METVLITGGAGFIGSNLAIELVNKGYSVKILDNLMTGKISNIEPILKNITFIKGDIRNLDLLKEAINDVDYIIHEAAQPSLAKSLADPVLTNEINIDGTLNVLLAAKNSKVKRVVYASSAAVYGDIAKLPIVETSELKPISPYAATKLAAENYCLVFARVFDLKTVCLRYFNVFGPNQDIKSEYATVIPKFINTMLRNQQPTIFGDGKQTRDFVYVKNVVEASILAMEKKKAVGEVFNIASGRKTNLNELVEKINEILDKNIEPTYTKPRQGDIKHSVADIKKAEKLLGYKVKCSLDKGLSESIEFFRNKNSVP